MDDDSRLAAIERTLLAIGDFLSFEGDRGWTYEQNRARMLEALDDMRRALPSRSSEERVTRPPQARVRTDAPGVDLSTGPDSSGQATDPVPANMPTTYLPNPDAPPAVHERSRSPRRSG